MIEDQLHLVPAMASTGLGRARVMAMSFATDGFSEPTPVFSHGGVVSAVRNGIGDYTITVPRFAAARSIQVTVGDDATLTSRTATPDDGTIQLVFSGDITSSFFDVTVWFEE